MTKDLSLYYQLIGDLFTWPTTSGEWNRFRLTDEQVKFYEANGYLAGIQLLNDQEVLALRAELTKLTDPAHPANPLFYEYHSNEASDPNKTLFHALGRGVWLRRSTICCGTQNF